MFGKFCVCSNLIKDVGYLCYKVDCFILKNEVCKDNCIKYYCKLCFFIVRFEKNSV